jgi:hypothetical protein
MSWLTEKIPPIDMLFDMWKVHTGRGGLIGAESTQQRLNGGEVTLRPTDLDPVQILQLSGENAPNPQTATLSLFRENLTADTLSTTPALVRAIVTYGAGRAGSRFVCDFHHGVRMSLDCSSFTVAAQYIQAVPRVGPTVKLKCTAVFGSVSKYRPLTFTELPETLAAAGSVQYVVPQFARTVTIISETTGRFTYLMNTSGAGAAISSALIQTDGASAAIIPDGAAALMLVNNTLAAGTYQVVWGLDI